MKKIFLLLFFCIFSLNAIHAEITYTLENGTLTISGTDMPNYNWFNPPWHYQLEEIKKVVIEDGVTNIGSYSFYGCSELTSVTIPNSVTKIGYNAFQDCI